MNGVHDMGGMDGFGKVEPEPNEPVFHAQVGRPRAGDERARWATPAPGTSTTSRFASGDAAAARSISRVSYYQKMARSGWRAPADRQGLHRRRRDRRRPRAATRPSRCKRGKLTADDVEPRHDARQVRPRQRTARRASSRATACAPGTSIRSTHTRLPRYVRGHVGVVERDHGCHVFPDSAATEARRESAMALHRRVRRRANCGAPDADPTVKVSIDAFEPYLEPA